MGGLLSVFIANILLVGWPDALFIKLEDVTLLGKVTDDVYGIVIRRISEGWVFDNYRQGYPFGSNILDYPLPDVGSHVILKIFALHWQSLLVLREKFKIYIINYEKQIPSGIS